MNEQKGLIDVITTFNQSHNLEDLLSRYGYKHHGGDRYEHPNSESKTPGLILKDNHAVIFDSTQTELGKSVDAFDLYKYYEHNNDIGEAIKAYADNTQTKDGTTISEHNRKQHNSQVNHAEVSEGIKPKAMPERSINFLPLQDFIAKYESRDFLIDNLIEEGRFYSLTAPTGTGKTAVALDMAKSISLGLPYGEHPCTQSDVLFLAGENPTDVRIRLMATIEQDERVGNAPIFIVEGSFDIDANREEIIYQLNQHPNIRCCFIDTLQAFFKGEDANSNTQMAQYARMLRTIAEERNIAIVVLAHPNKSATKDRNEPYGGGGFVNEVDGNLALWREDDDTISFYWAKKFRGSFEPFSIELKQVDVKTAPNKRGLPSNMLPITSKALLNKVLNQFRGCQKRLFLAQK
jgi:hypothetical protein